MRITVVGALVIAAAVVAAILLMHYLGEKGSPGRIKPDTEKRSGA